MRAEKRRGLAAVAAILVGSLAFASLGEIAVRAQQSGTVLPQTLTFAGSDSAVIEIDVRGPLPASYSTVLQLEFGPDGNQVTTPPPDPLLADTVRFTLSNSGNTASFSPAGGSAGGGTFPQKQVDLSRPDAVRAPGLYALSIIHLMAIPEGTTETWKLEIAGLPRQRLRADGYLTPGSAFRSLSPTGGSAGQPQFTVTPSAIATGTFATLHVTSSGGFDLSHVAPGQIDIAPADDVDSVQIHEPSEMSLTVSFVIRSSAEPGNRMLTITIGNVSVHQNLTFTQGPATSISPAGHNSTNSLVNATIEVVARGGADLSHVWSDHDVRVYPSADLWVVEVTHQTAGSFTVGLGWYLPLPDRNITRTLYVDSDVNLSAKFSLAELGEQRVCQPNQHCCESLNGVCTLCLPRDQLYR
jgi:hypothetical protein